MEYEFQLSGRLERAKKTCRWKNEGSSESADTDWPTAFLCDGNVLFENGNGFIFKETEDSSTTNEQLSESPLSGGS